ncbi:MAG: HmuY family protein [Bacteroidetes bacterium]|nr:HmuY family protein [Bacteroidota bacterium]
MSIKIKICSTLFLFGTILFYSCKKEELPVPKHDPGNVITSTVNMNIDYRYQIFYDLETNTAVSQNLKTTWDLGFETSESGYRVILNSAKAMYVYNTNSTDFNSVTDTSGLSAGKKMESPAGNMDSTAIGDWQTASNVYIIDRGYNETGVHQGFRKIIFQSVDGQKYSVHFAQLSGIGDTTLEIYKNSTYNFTFLSFSTNATVIIEPPKADWDIVFTQYLEAIPSPYLVVGALLNRYNTSAKMDSMTAFHNITYELAELQVLSSNINSIGYGWKEYNFSNSSYIVFPQMCYIIKDSKGIYYKLHFIDFYNISGNKGNPKWEYQKL